MSSETSLSYDGPLSTYSEWHAAGVGALVGLLIGWSQTLRHDIRSEPHYLLGAILVGAAVGRLFGGGD